MVTGKHYDGNRTQCPTSEKSTTRQLFAIAAAYGWYIENMDILNSYVYEPAMFHKPIFVTEIPQING